MLSLQELGPRETAATSPGPESDLSPQFHDKVNNQHSTHIPPSPQVHDKDNQHFTNIPPPVQFHDKDNQHSAYVPPSPPSYPTSGYPSHDFQPPPPPATNTSESPTYSQPYNHQSYPQEPQQPQQPQQHLPSNYTSLETSPSYSYPNFQTYPSFTESSLPAVPSHYPSYYQGSDAPYSHQSAPPGTNYSSTAPYRSTSANGSASEPSPPPPAQTYQYDSNYEPAPEKIAEAHKAARFAVGALAFDDVSVAVDFLKKSLELLTNPSAGQ